MLQFIADQIDQLDLALDQLAVHDRNFDRFAMMLIDNVVELTLHQHARAKSSENDLWGRASKPEHDAKLVSAALGPTFDAKVRLARSTEMIAPEVAESVQYLHSFRNTVYHQGKRHEGILHSLAIFYFKNACAVLQGFKPMWWSTSSRDRVSHRAIKYLGKPSLFKHRESVAQAYVRLQEVADSLGDSLIKDLASEVRRTIAHVDRQIHFLSSDSPEPVTRKQAIIAAQAWPFAFTDEGRQWASEHQCPPLSVAAYVDWLSAHYPWPVRSDPIASWTRRATALEKERNPHAGLKRYCDFMRQTEGLRAQIDEAAAQLDAHIQHLVDVARGK